MYIKIINIQNKFGRGFVRNFKTIWVLAKKWGAFAARGPNR